MRGLFWHVKPELMTERTLNWTKPAQVFKREISRFSGVPAVSPGSTLRCFNCNILGHSASQCVKPPRAKGSCYVCGSLQHQKKDCPRNTPTVVRPKTEHPSTSLLVEPSVSSGYMLSIGLSKENICIYVNSILDSGSVSHL